MSARNNHSIFGPANRAKTLATVSSLALCMGLPVAAFAQDAQEGPVADAEANPDDFIIVSGFRASLNRAQDIKQRADTVVDVISAEDIGALPDRSVAEALQRVPGVNISRFEQRDDPDRFSVEGSGVTIRGLPFVRSELNGRDIFSANGGRSLSFNDVSPELLGRVEVFKNNTADMIDGGISGTVNLVTRKPFDNPGLKIAGTIEANVGDLAEEWSPGFSGLISNTWDTSSGRWGLQLAYAQQELVTRTDASQITDPCYRTQALDEGCIRVREVGSGGFSGDEGFDASNFPPAGTVIVPKGAGVRTTRLTRDRRAYSAVGQWESYDGAVLATVEYLRSETEGSLSEFSSLALVNDDALFPVVLPGTTPVFNNGVAEQIALTQFQPFLNIQGGGLPVENLRFQREDQAMTEDASFSLQINPTDRLKLNFEAQYINSTREENGIILVMQTYANVFIDQSGKTPNVQFLDPNNNTANAAYFQDPTRNFFWFHLDNQVRNEGDFASFRGDVEYEIGDGFIKNARFGARWGDRNRTTRSANFSNWSNLGAPWGGRGGNWNCADFQAFGCGGAYAFDFPQQAEVLNVYGDNFQRGKVDVPFGEGAAFFYAGDNLVAQYLSGELAGDLDAIKAFALSPEARPLIDGRTFTDPVTGVVTNCAPFCPGEIIPIEETTKSAYARVDFGHDFDSGMSLSGNIGVRWVQTNVRSSGVLGTPQPTQFDAIVIDPDSGLNVGGNGDGVVQVEEVQNRCANTQDGQVLPGYCSLSAARQAEFAGLFTGEILNDLSDVTFDHWLPSFNVKLDFGNGMLVRAAASKTIFRPDLDEFRTGGLMFDNTINLRQGGNLETGPLLGLNTGNRNLRPTESWNYDLTFEWYFADVGSLTVAAFAKDVKKLEQPGASLLDFPQFEADVTDVLVLGPVNVNDGLLWGVEFAHQQTYDFLPGFLSGLGTQVSYTYVDGGEFTNAPAGDGEGEQSPFAANLPLAGISKHTVNATIFYEKGPLAMRAAYNWRSNFLQTPRDVIFPFSPIFGESTGQLDASIFYEVFDGVKLGVQGVNLLDEVTRTSQVFDFAGTRAQRSAFRNDRRFTFLARFDF